MMVADGARFLSAKFIASAATVLRISDEIEVMDDSICLKPHRISVSRSETTVQVCNPLSELCSEGVGIYSVHVRSISDVHVVSCHQSRCPSDLRYSAIKIRPAGAECCRGTLPFSEGTHSYSELT